MNGKYVALLVLVCMSIAMSHLCVYKPEQRVTDGEVLTEQEYNDVNLGKLTKCKRNVNVGVFQNRDSSTLGTVCGGNFKASWNTPGKIGPDNTFQPGQATTIKFLVNVAHIQPDPVARKGFIYMDYATKSTPEEGDFIPIGFVGSGNVNNGKVDFTWNVPNVSFDKGVFRAVYVTSTNATNPNPQSVGGVSNTYTVCADIAIKPTPVDGAASPLRVLWEGLF